MRKEMEGAYAELRSLAGVEPEQAEQRINHIIKQALSDFVKSCRCPAIWAYGGHTRMLMADYIFEMKPVRFIIDEFRAKTDAGGFTMIHSDEIEDKQIDGIIISSFRYRGEIAETIRSKFPHIRYLDIYETLRNHGIALDCEYYAKNHPYTRYSHINGLRRKLRDCMAAEAKIRLYWELLRELIAIKDFLSAITCAKKLMEIDRGGCIQKLLESLERIYCLELQTASAVSEKNVLMLCIDGLRRRDLFAGEMRKLKRYIDQNTFFFNNAYSVSTSTCESLLPVYSENFDLRTKYYEKSTVQEENCRFVNEAIRQGRHIHFYTDGCPYVESGHIQVQAQSRTAAEKLWYFLLDAADEENGLFYVHILYESHFSYPNPYTENNLVADGTSIFFDFLERSGGKLRTDYEAQKRDAIQYLDDLLPPFLERLRCPLVLFADHGNCVLRPQDRLEDVSYPQLTFGEELIQIPLAIRSKEMGVGQSSRICSLMDLNGIVVSLLRREHPNIQTYDYIKMLRSAIYNEDFKYLYRKLGYERGLGAFEAFLFQDGWKLVVYADGAVELYETASDSQIEDSERKKALLMQVKCAVTVYD